MDPLSSSVKTLKIPSLPPSSTNREFHHFTRTPHPHATASSPTTRTIPSLIPKKTNTFSHNHHKSSLPFSSSSNTSPLKPVFHNNPAIGYAAAIIDVSQKTNSLHSVQRDVNRLLKFLQSHGVEQGQALTKVVEHGNFNRHVIALVKMLVKKNKVGIGKEVLEEFERIYDELCRTQVVLVSSATKMGEHQLFGIAKSVQQLSGAARVKVKNLVQQRFSSFTSANHSSKSELYL